MESGLRWRVAGRLGEACLVVCVHGREGTGEGLGDWSTGRFERYCRSVGSYIMFSASSFPPYVGWGIIASALRDTSKEREKKGVSLDARCTADACVTLGGFRPEGSRTSTSTRRGNEGQESRGNNEYHAFFNLDCGKGSTKILLSSLRIPTSLSLHVFPSRAFREERLSRKVARLGQLQKMLAVSVFLERPAHLAIVISIWRR